MNPILSQLKGTQNNTSQKIIDMAAAIKSGRTDAKHEVIKILQQLSPDQRYKLRAAMPLLKAFARRQGVSDNNIDAFMQEINI